MIERIDLVHVGEVQGIKVKWRELGWDKLAHNPMYECTPLETAAYMLGIMSISLEIDELIAQTEKIVSG